MFSLFAHLSTALYLDIISYLTSGNQLVSPVFAVQPFERMERSQEPFDLDNYKDAVAWLLLLFPPNSITTATDRLNEPGSGFKTTKGAVEVERDGKSPHASQCRCLKPEGCHLLCWAKLTSTKEKRGSSTLSPTTLCRAHAAWATGFASLICRHPLASSQPLSSLSFFFLHRQRAEDAKEASLLC